MISKVNFGDVYIPSELVPPARRVLPEFKRLAHGLRSGNITILDARTFYIPNLHYDGAGPDAYFFVGKGDRPHSAGRKIPNEKGRYGKRFCLHYNNHRLCQYGTAAETRTSLMWGDNKLLMDIFFNFSSMDVLQGYEGEDIELSLPQDMTVMDIDWLAVWCVA